MSATSGVEEAARNNAEWCDAFCRTYGAAGRFDTESWSCERRTPPLYPDAVTLRPGVSVERLLSRVDAGPGCSIKDSFADLALAPAGLDILFRAEWLCQSPSVDTDTAPGWSRVTMPADLERWESAWGGSPAAHPFFLAALLANETVAVLARYEEERRPITGAIANRSTTEIGLTNIFDTRGDLESAWAGGASAARALWGPLPVVGYDSGAAVEAARRAGFATIGEVVVWAKGQADEPTI